MAKGKLYEIGFKLAAKLSPSMAASFNRSAQLMQKQQTQMVRVSEAELRVAKAASAMSQNAGKAERAEMKQSRAALQLERTQLKLIQQTNGVTNANRRLEQSADRASRASRRQASETGGMGGALRGAIGLAAGYLSIQAIATAYKDVTTAINDSNRAEQRLQTLMGNVRGTRQADIESVKRYAAQLQRKTVVEDDTTVAGASQLATYQLQAKYIKQLLPAMQDLAVGQYGVNVNQEQMQQSGNLIGKVFTGQVGALRKAGVSFSKTQEAMLKNGNQAQKTAMIVKVLKENYGGLATTMAQTPEGREIQLANAWGDLKERMGAGLIPLRTKFVEYLSNNLPRIQRTIDMVFKAFGTGWNMIKPYIMRFWAILTEMGPRIMPSLTRIGQAFTGMGNPIENLMKTASPVITWFTQKALPLLMRMGADLSEIFAKAWPRIQPVLQKMSVSFGKLLTSILPIVQRVWAIIKPILSFLLKYVLPAILTVITKILDAVTWLIGKSNKLGNVVGKLFGGGNKQTPAKQVKIGRNAYGGMVHQQQLSWLAEGNKPELVLPLTNQPRTQQLLQSAGLGGVTFAPVIHISGGGSNTRAEVEAGLRTGLQEFEAMYERMMARRGRVSYAG